MDTFLIFLFVFVIFGWCIWKLLQFTKNTIGVNSPLKIERVYQTSAFQYFVTFENGLIYCLIIQAGFFFRLLFTIEISSSQNRSWFAPLLVFLAFLVSLLSIILYLVLLLNHWKYTERIIILTYPKTHEIEIDLDGQIFRLREADVNKIRIVHTNTKLNFGYLTYYLSDGNSFILSDRMNGSWVIQEYFRNAAVEYKVKRFPFIK